MADRIQYIMDQQSQTLRKLQDFNIFNSHEIKDIVKKRTNYEYILRRRELQPNQYNKYLEYEKNLDTLLNLRLSRFHPKSTNSSDSTDTTAIQKDRTHEIRNLQAASIRHICNIFDRSIRRFPDNIDMWNDYISFLKYKKSYSILGTIFGKAMSLHPRLEQFWLQAAIFELDRNNNTHAARILLQRSLRFNSTSERLWAYYFDLETLHLLKIIQRQKLLQMNESSIDYSILESTSIIVFKHAIRAIPTVSFAMKLYTSCLQILSSLNNNNDNKNVRSNNGNYTINILEKMMIEKFGISDTLIEHFIYIPINSILHSTIATTPSSTLPCVSSEKNHRMVIAMITSSLSVYNNVISDLVLNNNNNTNTHDDDDDEVSIVDKRMITVTLSIEILNNLLYQISDHMCRHLIIPSTTSNRNSSNSSSNNNDDDDDENKSSSIDCMLKIQTVLQNCLTTLVRCHTLYDTLITMINNTINHTTDNNNNNSANSIHNTTSTTHFKFKNYSLLCQAQIWNIATSLNLKLDMNSSNKSTKSGSTNSNSGSSSSGDDINRTTTSRSDDNNMLHYFINKCFSYSHVLYKQSNHHQIHSNHKITKQLSLTTTNHHHHHHHSNNIASSSSSLSEMINIWTKCLSVCLQLLIRHHHVDCLLHPQQQQKQLSYNNDNNNNDNSSNSSNNNNSENKITDVCRKILKHANILCLASDTGNALIHDAITLLLNTTTSTITSSTSSVTIDNDVSNNNSSSGNSNSSQNNTNEHKTNAFSFIERVLQSLIITSSTTTTTTSSTTATTTTTTTTTKNSHHHVNDVCIYWCQYYINLLITRNVPLIYSITTNRLSIDDDDDDDDDDVPLNKKQKLDNYNNTISTITAITTTATTMQSMEELYYWMCKTSIFSKSSSSSSTNTTTTTTSDSNSNTTISNPLKSMFKSLLHYIYQYIIITPTRQVGLVEKQKIKKLTQAIFNQLIKCFPPQQQQLDKSSISNDNSSNIHDDDDEEEEEVITIEELMNMAEGIIKITTTTTGHK